MKLAWDEDSKRLYETGVSKAVLYPMAKGGTYPKGYAWNGVSSVKDTPSGAEAKAVYANNSKYLSLLSNEELGGTVEAYTYPDEFKECDGSKEACPGVFMNQQDRKKFGLSYQTILGNDDEMNDHGYKIHLIYGCLASPSAREHNSINENTEAMSMSWEFDTTPVKTNIVVDGKAIKPISSIEIDSTKVEASKLAKLEEILYGKDPTTTGGSDGVEARLPLPDEVYKILSAEG